MKKYSNALNEKGRHFIYGPQPSSKPKLFAPIQRNYKVPVSAAGARRNHSNLYGGKRNTQPVRDDQSGKQSVVQFSKVTTPVASSIFNN